MCSSPKLISLKSSDHVTLEVTEAVAFESQTIKEMVKDECSNTPIFLANVTASILAKVIDYCTHHAEADKDLKSFDAAFVNVDQATLYDLMLAANYLKIKSLQDLTGQTVVERFKGKTPEEMKELLFIENDCTEEEEEVARRENAWAFM